MLRAARLVAGVLLVWGAVGVAAYTHAYQQHTTGEGRSLAAAARAQLRRHHATAGVACTDAAGAGQLGGVLLVPSLGVTAPVEDGTSDAVLSAAVGHAPGYPWPGQPGTSVLLAHDVSYFADIDKLQPGAVIEYETPCVVYRFAVTGHQVVAAGSPVAAAAGPGGGAGVVLDTCWPTDALWFTPDRYLVSAVETGFTQRLAPAARVPAPPAVDFTTPAPAALVAQGLTLEDNEEPMGTLTTTGTPAAAWVASPAPLSLTGTALEAFFGALHAVAQGEEAWWAALAPGVPVPPPLAGAREVSHDAPLDVAVAVDGTRPTAVVLSTVVGLSGGSGAGTYRESVTEAVRGQVVTITGWTLTPG